VLSGGAAAAIQGKQVKKELQGTLLQDVDSGAHRIPTLMTMKKDNLQSERSPSFSYSNLFLAAAQSSNTEVQGAGVAVSPDWVLWTTGLLVSVVNKTLPGTVVASFLLPSLGLGNCSSGTANGGAQVSWDHEAQRWIAAHYGGTGDVFCVYVSLTSDPTGAYHTLGYANMAETSFFQLAVWGRTYAITLDESGLDGLPIPSNPLCVLDREAVLAWNETFVEYVSTFNETTNVTTVEAVVQPTPLPGLFCGAALNPLTHLTRWTPVHAQQEAPPAGSTESSGAGTPGAVFMRAIDDEYQFGETLTPLTDQLEVEHWYNLNWTTATYGVIRYKFSVADFSQAPGTVCGAACVPTPTSTYLNASTGILMPKLSYRRIPATGQESVVATLSSHSNDDDIARYHWFELRWAIPTTIQSEPIWLLYQQGVSPTDDGLHKFLPAACMDANGTIAIGYSVSNNQTVYPGLWATSRLGNDPNNTLRIPASLHEGALGSVISPLSPVWGPAWTMACDPSEARWFYFSGAVSDLGSDRVTWLDRIRVLGEIVERRWRADDYCGSSDNCTQYITTI
jgi:hypothetical protein